MDDLAMRLERLENESALTRLVYNYCHGIDRHDLERFLSIWSVDAIWDVGPPLGKCTGITEIQKGLSEGVWPAFQASQHCTTNLVFDIDGDKARGLSNVTFQGVGVDGSAIMVASTYRDRFSRQDGRWYLTERLTEFHHSVPLLDVSLPPAAG